MSNILIGEDEKEGRKHRMQKGDTGNKKTEVDYGQTIDSFE